MLWGWVLFSNGGVTYDIVEQWYSEVACSNGYVWFSNERYCHVKFGKAMVMYCRVRWSLAMV